MKQFAKFLQNELSTYLPNDNIKEPENLSNSDRYVVYKVGPVLAINVSIIHEYSCCSEWLMQNFRFTEQLVHHPQE